MNKFDPDSVKFHHAPDVQFLNCMGGDLDVVNDARVSMDKHHDVFDNLTDEKLIKYLAKNKHWTPFSQTMIKLYLHLPLFVFRQWQRSEQGRTFNEGSRRYIDGAPEFYIQNQYHYRPEKSVKQGRGEPLVKEENYRFANIEAWSRCVQAAESYHSDISQGYAPEEARQFLPQNLMIKVRMTGSLYFWARVCKQRLDPHAQLAVNQLAQMVAEVCEPVAPISWRELMKYDIG